MANINIAKHIKNSPLGDRGASLAFGEAVPSLLFFFAVFLFFGLFYPHHLHYQEQFQLFLFDSNYVWDIVKVPGGVADLLGRFCTQFFLFAWVGAFIIAFLLTAVQLLTYCLTDCRKLYGLSFIPSFLLWLFFLDENALLGGIWAVLITLAAVCCLAKLPSGWTKRILIVLAIPVVYWMVGCPLPTGRLWFGVHYHRYPSVFPWLLWIAVISAFLIALLGRWANRKFKAAEGWVVPLLSFALVAVVMGSVVWKNTNFKAEKVMQYDFMACHQQWNRILATVDKEKPNNQIGVTVQNLALAMQGQLIARGGDYNQNGLLGLLPDVERDATSPMPTAEALYQLGMIYAAQRTVFEAQEAILDFQKSGRCYKRLAQTNLIIGSYEVSRKYLLALQKTLFYSDWANETMELLGNEKAIAKHPEYGRLRRMIDKENYYFSDHVTPDMLKQLYLSNPENSVAYQYMMASFLLTGDSENFYKFTNQK